MDNTMLATLAAICGLTSEEKGALGAIYANAVQENPDVLQSISGKVQQAMIEFMQGTHKSNKRVNRRRKMKDYEIVCDVEVGHICYTLFRSWIGLYSDKPYLAAEWVEEAHADGYRNLYFGDYHDVLMNYFERINHRLETMAYLKDKALDPDHMLFDRHCIEDSRDKLDYTGEVLVLLPACFNDGCGYADLQYYLALGGPGCNPMVECDWTNKDWIEGVQLATGERWTRYRMLTAGIIKPDLLPACAAEKVIEIKATTQT